MKKTFIIKNESQNSRLDRWFKRTVFNVPQSLIEKNIRKGNIKVNGKIKKSSYKISNGDIIKVFNMNFTMNKKNTYKNRYVASQKEIKKSSSMIIENNDNFIIINKPAGIAVQSGTKSKKNILDILRNMNEFKNATPFTVHRLDKETTGVMIFAKNREYAQLFTSLFRIRKIYKTYICVTLGGIENGEKGLFNDDLITYEGRKKIISKAITRYEVIDSNNNFSLLKLNPETGRKHQLRKQLLVRGHPILGDTKYSYLKSKIKNSKLMLHSYLIKFSINNIKYSFMAKLPETFQETLKEKHLKIY